MADGPLDPDLSRRHARRRRASSRRCKPGFAGLYQMLGAAGGAGRGRQRAAAGRSAGPKRAGVVTFRFGEPIPPGLPRDESSKRGSHAAINALNAQPATQLVIAARPKSGARIVLALLDDRAADRAGAGEQVEQRVAVAPADRALQRGQILGEALEHLEHRLPVGEEHVAPHRRVATRRCG